MTRDWSRRLDGAVYGQPLVIGGVVVAVTENDSVYGLRRSTGQVLWRAHVGTPTPLSAQHCGDISPLGITSTPVSDRADGLVYAVAQTTSGRTASGRWPRPGLCRGVAERRVSGS
ncbi:MAG: PQQ-binding-like beta-propeller repeat protein [Streptosporangiaceae bacterium]